MRSTRPRARQAIASGMARRHSPVRHATRAAPQRRQFRLPAHESTTSRSGRSRDAGRQQRREGCPARPSDGNHEFDLRRRAGQLNARWRATVTIRCRSPNRGRWRPAAPSCPILPAPRSALSRRQRTAIRRRSAIGGSSISEAIRRSKVAASPGSPRRKTSTGPEGAPAARPACLRCRRAGRNSAMPPDGGTRTDEPPISTQMRAIAEPLRRRHEGMPLRSTKTASRVR